MFYLVFSCLLSSLVFVLPCLCIVSSLTPVTFLTLRCVFLSIINSWAFSCLCAVFCVLSFLSLYCLSLTFVGFVFVLSCLQSIVFSPLPGLLRCFVFSYFVSSLLSPVCHLIFDCLAFSSLPCFCRLVFCTRASSLAMPIVLLCFAMFPV